MNLKRFLAMMIWFGLGYGLLFLFPAEFRAKFYLLLSWLSVAAYYAFFVWIAVIISGALEKPDGTVTVSSSLPRTLRPQPPVPLKDSEAYSASSANR